jgi:hypothetical protein
MRRLFVSVLRLDDGYGKRGVTAVFLVSRLCFLFHVSSVMDTLYSQYDHYKTQNNKVYIQKRLYNNILVLFHTMCFIE